MKQKIFDKDIKDHQNLAELVEEHEKFVEKENKPNQKKVVAKPHGKRPVVRCQLQAIQQLDSGVNKLADVNAKRLKMEEKDRESSLCFQKDYSSRRDYAISSNEYTTIDMYQFLKSSFYFPVYGTFRFNQPIPEQQCECIKLCATEQSIALKSKQFLLLYNQYLVTLCFSWIITFLMNYIIDSFYPNVSLVLIKIKDI